MLIAFDPGLLCGCAWVEGGKPRSHLIDLRTGNEGATYSRANYRFREYINPGDIVAVEAMILPGKISIASRLSLFAIRSIAVMVAFERNARLIEVPPHTWRSHFIGVVQAPKQVPRQHRRAWLKARTQDRVKELGWGEPTVDECDALGLLSYLRASLDPTYVETMPLFGGR